MRSNPLSTISFLVLIFFSSAAIGLDHNENGSVDRDEVESLGSKFVTSDSWNGTISLKANNIPMGWSVLKHFNVTPGSQVYYEVHTGSPSNATEGEIFTVTTAGYLQYPTGKGQPATYPLASFDYTDKIGVTTGMGISSTLGPCDPIVLLQTAQGLSTYFTFQSNVTMTLKVAMAYEIYDTSIRNKMVADIPSQRSFEYLTYVPVNNSYDLTLFFESTNPNITISDRLTSLYTSCSPNPTFNMSTLDVPKWDITLVGQQGPTVIQIFNKRLSTQDITLTFVESENTGPSGDDDDDGLKVWQIILIAIGGAVAVAFVVAIIAIVVVLVYRHRRGYTTLNSSYNPQYP